MSCRRQLGRALVDEIIVDIDQAAREIVLFIHWKGGPHSELRFRKPANTRSAPPTTPWRSSAAWRPLVRPRDRGHPHPDGPADWAGQDKDRPTSSLDPLCPHVSRIGVIP